MPSIIKIILFSALLSPSAYAWDQHHFITESALEPLKNQLSESVLIRSFEDYLKNAFPGCTKERFFENVMEGVGENYKVSYADEAIFKFKVSDDLLSVNTYLKLLPEVFQPGSPFPGYTAPISKVLSVYTDEPDWLLDSDVPRLKDAGLAKGVKGTGSMVLRHFWFGRGDLRSKGVETLTHAQRIYELALASFAAGEDYWGYRFLGHVIHYLQDLTQPFHVKIVPTLRMSRFGETLRSFACGALPCEKKLSRKKAIYFSGLAISTYHTIYESYVRELFRTKEALKLVASGTKQPPQIVFNPKGSLPRFVDFSEIEHFKTVDITEGLEEVARRTRFVAHEFGVDTYATLGSRYKTKKGMLEVLRNNFTDLDPGMRLAHGDHKIRWKNRIAHERFKRLTLDLMAFTGQLTRELVENALLTSRERKNGFLGRLQKQCL